MQILIKIKLLIHFAILFLPKNMFKNALFIIVLLVFIILSLVGKRNCSSVHLMANMLAVTVQK